MGARQRRIALEGAHGEDMGRTDGGKLRAGSMEEGKNLMADVGELGKKWHCFQLFIAAQKL